MTCNNKINLARANFGGNGFFKELGNQSAETRKANDLTMGALQQATGLGKRMTSCYEKGLTEE